MTVLWDKLKQNFIENLHIAINKTEELTSVGRIKLEILQVEHRLDEKLVELGRYVNKQLSDVLENLPIDAKIIEIRKEIKNLEVELREKEQELGRIREEDGIDFDS